MPEETDMVASRPSLRPLVLVASLLVAATIGAVATTDSAAPPTNVHHVHQIVLLSERSGGRVGAGFAFVVPR